MAVRVCVGVGCLESAQFSERDSNEVRKVRTSGSSPYPDPGVSYWTLSFKGPKGPSGACCFPEKWPGSAGKKIRFQGLLPKLILSNMRESWALWWGLKKIKYFFNRHIFYYYIHIKMVSNMPYQMVYSNCQNQGWSVNSFLENLLRDSSSGEWAVTSHKCIYHQPSLKILEGGSIPSKGHGGTFREKRKEADNLNFTKKPNVHTLPRSVHSTRRRGSALWPGRWYLHDEWWLLGTFPISAELWDVSALPCKIKLCLGIRENGKRKGSITGTSTIGLGLGWDAPALRCRGRAQAHLGNTVGLVPRSPQ